MLAQLSRSQPALGSPARTAASADEAVEHLQIATVSLPQMRDAWLNLAEALAWRAKLRPDEVAALRERASNAHAQADRLQPLKADYAEAFSVMRQRAER